MGTKQVKKNGEGIKLVDYEISMASLMLDFFNEKRHELGMGYQDLATAIGLNYSVLYNFLNYQSNYYLVHAIDFFVMESMRDKFQPEISEIYTFVFIHKYKTIQSPFFLEKLNYLKELNGKFVNQIISEHQFYDLLRYRYNLGEEKTPKTITELMNLYNLF